MREMNIQVQTLKNAFGRKEGEGQNLNLLFLKNS